MVFISLGYACLVRQSIDIYNGFRVETNFFDWLLTNFTTIIFIIQNIDNPDAFLTHDRFTDKGITDNNITHRFVEHKELYFTSLHDFPAELGYWDYVNTFIEKYKRRLLRLKSIILNSTEKIDFIHYIGFSVNIPTMEQIYYFITSIQNINPLCNFNIHLCIAPDLYDNSEQINQLKITNHVNVHYMVSDGTGKNLQRTDLNWKHIYDNIKNNNN